MDGTFKKIRVQPTGAALGADVSGFDIGALDPGTFAELRQAWLENLVIRVRGLDISDEDQVALSSLFGDLVDQPRHRKTGQPYIPDKPMLSMISNIRVNGEYIGALGDAEVNWHTDMAFTQNPPSATLLHALEIPPHGGSTWFVNMYMAYETLPDAERRMVEGRQVKIGNVRDGAGSYRYGRSEADFKNLVECPGPIHNLVRTHPETGRKILYLGMPQDAYIMGMPVDESTDLLKRLWAHATQDIFTWAQEWQVGDLIIWDNRCTMHRRDPFDPASRRRLHRTVVAGDGPKEHPGVVRV